MFITIPISHLNNISNYLMSIKAAAYLQIYTHKYSVHEQKINKLLKTKYNITLLKACSWLISQAIIQKTSTLNYTVVFRGAKADKIARLITYGNGVIPGSNILYNAFTSK